MKQDVLNWFANGQTGLSSKAMAFAAVGIEYSHRYSADHPSDPADFNRCLLLLEAIPEVRNHFDKVAELSNIWRALVARWDEVEKCFLDEVGRDWSKARSAPKTYKLMKSIGC